MIKDKRKRRNYLAKELWTPKYRKRVVQDKKKKEQKEKARKKVDITKYE